MSSQDPLENPSALDSTTQNNEHDNQIETNSKSDSSGKSTSTETVIETVIDDSVKDTEGKMEDQHDPGVKPKRIRTLTMKAKEQYETDIENYTSRLINNRKNIESIIDNYKKDGSVTNMKTVSEQMKQELQSYQLLSEQFVGYLKRTNTDDSVREEWSHMIVYNSTVQKTQAFINEIYQDIIETTSKSTKSNSARSSKSSLVLLRQKAKMEATKKRLEFAQKEAELERAKTKIEQDELKAQAELLERKSEAKLKIELLQSEKEAAIAEAEFIAVKEEVDCKERGLLSVPEDNKNERIQQYLREQRTMIQESNLEKEHLTFQNNDNIEQLVNREASTQKASAQPGLNPRADDFVPRRVSFQPPINQENVERNNPKTIHDIPQNTYMSNDFNIASDFTRFLLKKDLLMSRFNTFNDRPEYYPSWKESFKVIMNEMTANASEEIDLLIKWAGPQSRSHVQSIKASNSNNPQRALQLIWERLDERYGSPELIDTVLKNKLESFPRITNKDFSKLYDLSDILSEILSLKQNTKYRVLFSYFDSSIGVSPIVAKLPYQLQEKWTGTAVSYNNAHGMIYPPFSVFADFIRQQSKIRNNPSFAYENPSKTYSAPMQKERSFHSKPTDIRVRKSEFAEEADNDKLSSSNIDPKTKCPIHSTRHSLNECRTFRSKPLHERKRFLRQNNICFRCCESISHKQRDCKNVVKCKECGSEHPTALHIRNQQDQLINRERPKYGGENDRKPDQWNDYNAVKTNCTQICFDKYGGKSCSKVVLVNAYMRENPCQKIKLYAMIDDQSNRTLGKSQLFDQFGCSTVSEYSLSTCSGKSKLSGRKLASLVVRSLDGTTELELSDILECSSLPDSKDEIPTREVAIHHPHLNKLIDFIPPLDEDSEILLLIGRDAIQAHHVFDQIVGPNNNSPYAQKLSLGWTIIGETCLGKVHRPDKACVKKTYLQGPDRLSIFPPCTREMKIDEQQIMNSHSEVDSIGQDVFVQTNDDNKPGLSRDDREFLDIMENDFRRDSSGKWCAPLPFRNNRPILPNNKIQAQKRARSLDLNLRKNPEKQKHFQTFMKDIFEKGHAEVAPDIDEKQEQWYLPIFGVYHPKKPGKLRAVFDSSAKFDGISLNDVLLSGPDLTNSLLGVLLRFRKEQVAVMGDIEQMFYAFKVNEKHRDYLRFYWYKDNDFNKPLTVYRMCVHVFWNSPSPAVATYGLRKTALEGELEFGSDMVNFVTRDFYVDDGLTSQTSSENAINLMKRTQQALQKCGNIRLHKISSNKEIVMNAFDSEDLAKELKDLDLDSSALPMQRSLGMNWDLSSDCFTFQIAKDAKPFTRRGLLSTINSIYDPLGFLAPVTIAGKLLLRSAMTANIPWDEPLPQDYLIDWENWRSSLHDLETLQIPRMFLPLSFQANHKTVHIYSDASEKAIAAVGYLQLGTEPKSGFVIGKAKVAPSHGHTIPRLELCGAVLATELGQIVSDNLNIQLKDIHYYTDSRVVLGYIHNSSRRFYTYVSNRVAKIHQVSDPSQWSYVHTDKNPADLATRSVPAEKLHDSIWLSGPPIRTNVHDHEKESNFPLLEPDNDKEIRTDIKVSGFKTNSMLEPCLGSHRFEKFSDWKALVRSIALLKNFIRRFRPNIKCFDECSSKEAEMTIIRIIQREKFGEEISNLENSTPIHKASQLFRLNPFIDENNILRVGGRLSHANVCSDERNPIIIPGKSWIAILLIRHIHAKVQHQGRHFTSGAVKSNGYWITGGKRVISSVLHKCVTCRKLRRPNEHQKMADLPSDRVQPGPLFTSVGIDTFGPWSIVTRKTRGGAANSKRWAIIFTCLTTRGVHIEVVEEMSTSSFINSFKRFIAIRGNVKLIRSDRGTNFIGATDQLAINAINVEDGPMKHFM